MAAEVGRFGLGSELLGLKTAKAEGVQAEKGAGVIEGLLAHRALGQLVDCRKGEGKENKEKDEEGVSEHVVVELKGELRRRMRE